MTAILNFCLTAAIHFHNTLNVFLTDRGTGTASLEDKMLQQLMSMREEVLHDIFISHMTPWTAIAAYTS